MAIFQKSLSGTCEITTGTFTPTTAMPMFTGENNSIVLSVAFQHGGVDYDIPLDVTVRAYLYYGARPAMTPPVLMDVVDNVASCALPDTFMPLSGSPQVVVRMVGASSEVAVACAFAINVKAVTTDNMVYLSPPNPDTITYIGRSPYIGENGNWYTFSNTMYTYVDTGTSAVPTADDISTDTTDVSVQDALNAHTSQLADVAPKTNNRNWLYEGRDLKALFGTAAAFRTAVAEGDFSKIRIGDYWPISLSGTFRDVGSYTCPSGTTYYSDTGLTTSAGTTGQAYEATYVNATYCSISISSTTYYVSTAACLAYFVRTLSNAVVNLEVAGINLYYKHGDTALAVPHILFCPRDCLPISCRMRKTDAIWHSEATTNPWLGSAMYATLNDATYGLLPLIAATDIGAYIFGGLNGAGMRALLPEMASGVSAPSSWAWRDRGKLFLPMEREVWGSTIWADNAFSQGLSVQWPIFIGTLRHIVKGLGNAGSRTNWWCATAAHAASFARVGDTGYPNNNGASYAHGVAPCFLIS